MQYGTATIQQFLNTKFSNEQLTSVSYEYFPEVYMTFETGVSKQEKVKRLLGYCQRQDRITSLLAMMERERPYEYKAQYSSVLGTGTSRSKLIARRNPQQLFISHSYEDADLATYFAADLRKRGWPVWIGRASVRPGEKWLEAVNRGLDESGILLLLLTPEAVSSDWVRSETSLAGEQNATGQLQIILVEMKPTANVPGEWGDYRRLPFNRGYKQGVHTLVSVLESLAGPVAKAAAPPVPPVRPPDEQPSVVQQPVEPPQPPAPTTEEAEPDEPPPEQPVSPVEGSVPEKGQSVAAERQRPAMDAAVMPAEAPDESAAKPGSRGKRRARPPAADKGGNMLWEKDGKEMARIPAGEFRYGPAGKERSLPDFWIDRTPVTNAQYARFIASSGRKPPEHWGGDAPPDDIADHPVVYVSWDDAAAYAAWFGKRLPKEEEWEKAARGPDGWIYPWGDEEPTAEHCNFDGKVGTTTAVKRYSPKGDSCYGCTDMAGNVWEWTDSTTVEVLRVFRGGAFNRSAEEMRASHRDGFLPDEKRRDLGFRTVVRLS